MQISRKWKPSLGAVNEAGGTSPGSRLDWQEPDLEPQASQLRLHRALLRLRQIEPALQHGPNATHDAQGIGDDALILQRANQGSELRIIVQLRSGGMVTVPRDATLVMTTEDAEFTQDPCPLKSTRTTDSFASNDPAHSCSASLILRNYLFILLPCPSFRQVAAAKALQHGIPMLFRRRFRVC